MATDPPRYSSRWFKQNPEQDPRARKTQSKPESERTHREQEFLSERDVEELNQEPESDSREFEWRRSGVTGDWMVAGVDEQGRNHLWTAETAPDEALKNAPSGAVSEIRREFPGSSQAQKATREAGSGGGGGGGGGSDRTSSGNTGPSRRELRGRAKKLHPWLPEDLLSTFVDSWIETGDPQQALAEMRQSGNYEQHFPAIFRDDGTMRMGEREYLATRAQMEQQIASYDVNPERFQSHITRAIEGEQSPQELRGRLSAMWGRVLDNADAVRQEFGRHYNIDNLSDSALFASALDPELGQDVLNRRIDVAEVAGGFRDAAWQRSESRIRELMNEGVEGFGQARSLARQITRRSENLSVLGRRHNEGDFSRRDVEEATVFEDQGEQRRIKRTMAAEQSLFSPSGRFRQDESGALSGLRQR